MSCHDIGMGMNSVVKVALEMYDNGELDLAKTKKIIRACRKGVHWCDGNEYEAIECMRDIRCNKCLRYFEDDEEVVDMFENDVFNKVFNNYSMRDYEARYDIVGEILCRGCSKETVASMEKDLATEAE